MKSARFWAVVTMLVLAAVLLIRRGDRDHAPATRPLAQFPGTLAQWRGENVPIDPDILTIMGKGVFLNRLYTEPKVPATQGLAAGPVALFIAYFPTQRSGQSIHSPQNCLPGAGWTFESSGTTVFTDALGLTHQVGDFIITDGSHRDEVLYWYQSHGRTIASDYRAKLAMVIDSIRYNRSDAALVRTITPIQGGETQAQAHARVVKFAEQLMPMLPPFVPN